MNYNVQTGMNQKAHKVVDYKTQPLINQLAQKVVD